MRALLLLHRWLGISCGWILLLFSLQWIIQLNSDGTGYLAQRCMACRSEFDSKLAAVVFVFTQVLLRSLLWLPLGVGLLLLYPPDPGLATAALTADREATYVRGMADLLPAGVMGIMVTGMLAFSGILLALNERHTSGRGQLVDCSLLDTAVTRQNHFPFGRGSGHETVGSLTVVERGSTTKSASLRPGCNTR